VRRGALVPASHLNMLQAVHCVCVSFPILPNTFPYTSIPMGRRLQTKKSMPCPFSPPSPLPELCCASDALRPSSVPIHGPGALQRVTPLLPPPHTFPHPPLPMGRRMKADRADPPHLYVLYSTPKVAYVQCRAHTLPSPKRTQTCGARRVLSIRLSFCRNSGRLPSWVRQKQSRRSFELRICPTGSPCGGAEKRSTCTKTPSNLPGGHTTSSQGGGIASPVAYTLA